MQQYVKRWLGGRLRLMRIAVAALALVSLAANESEDDVEFVPRTNTPPARRVGAGTRNPAPDTLKICALAPLKTLGYTTREQPTVYFVLSRGTDKKIEVGVNDLSQPENPVGELVWPKGHAAGLLKLDLAQVKDAAGKPIRLAPGRRYEVALVAAGEAAAGDSADEGAVLSIQRLAADAVDGPPPHSPAAAASWYAKRGVWFDCIDAVNRAITAKPDDKKLFAARRKLLDREGIVQAPDGTISEKKANEK